MWKCEYWRSVIVVLFNSICDNESVLSVFGKPWQSSEVIIEVTERHEAKAVLRTGFQTSGRWNRWFSTQLNQLVVLWKECSTNIGIFVTKVEKIVRNIFMTLVEKLSVTTLYMLGEQHAIEHLSKDCPGSRWGIRRRPVRCLHLISMFLTSKKLLFSFRYGLFGLRLIGFGFCKLKLEHCLSEGRPPPLKAILVIFGRRALIFFVWNLLENMKITPLLCACTVVITLEKNVEKRHLAPLNLIFY